MRNERKTKFFSILDSSLNIQTKNNLSYLKYNYYSRVGSIFFDYDFPLEISNKDYIDNNLWNYNIINKIKTCKNKKLYNCKIIKCGEVIQVYKVSNFRAKQEDGLEKDEIDENLLFKDKKSIEKEPRLQSIEERNILRSKFNLQRIIKCNINEFKTFITLTFDSNKVDIDINEVKQANKKFNIWRTKISEEMKKLNKEFKYVCVPEFQKRGAVHYHLMTNIEYDSELLASEERKIWNKQDKMFHVMKDVKYWSYGINGAKNITDMNVVGYISKYMTKDIDNRLFGHNRYLASRNLERPKELYLNLNNTQDENIYNLLVGGKNLMFNNEYYDYNGNKVVFLEMGNSGAVSQKKNTTYDTDESRKLKI